MYSLGQYFLAGNFLGSVLMGARTCCPGFAPCSRGLGPADGGWVLRGVGEIDVGSRGGWGTCAWELGPEGYEINPGYGDPWKYLLVCICLLCLRPN